MSEPEYPEAMKCLGTDLEECLTVLRFPEPHRKRIRTTNLLERLFGEGRRRTKVIPRFMNDKSGLGLMFAVLVDASAGWHGIRMNPAIGRELEVLTKNSWASLHPNWPPEKMLRTLIGRL
jgi:transposase-like protein